VAKKRIRQPPRFKGKKVAVVYLDAKKFDRIDLKGIGAAFDHVLEHLDRIKPKARNRAAVQKKIKRLENLQRQVARECPQFWFETFELAKAAR